MNSLARDDSRIRVVVNAQDVTSFHSQSTPEFRIVRVLVRQRDAQIEPESGNGAYSRVFIPVSSQFQAGKNELNKNKLIVEDEGIVSLERQERLEKMGHRVIGVADTDERAVELSSGGHPDLVLMDIPLKSTMDGTEAARIIRTTSDVGRTGRISHRLLER